MNNVVELFPTPDQAGEETEARATPIPAAAAPEEVVIEAQRQITFRCGKSSITLYPNGKIALRGEYILSDATGINRIVGGQIELN